MNLGRFFNPRSVAKSWYIPILCPLLRERLDCSCEKLESYSGFVDK